MWSAKDLCSGLYYMYRIRPRLATLLEIMVYHVISTLMTLSSTLHDQVAAVQVIESCLNDIDEWMLANMLKLNRDKIELLVIGPKHKVNPPIKGIHVASDYIEASSSARNIGVIFDSHGNLEKLVMNTCKMTFHHLRNIVRIRN